MIDSTPRLLRQLAQQARRGFVRGLKPEFVLDGSGGTYFLHDTRKVKVAVFKPADEEPYAENNPRGYVHGQGPSISLREGIKPGEACIREVAAYLLDHEGFSEVPMTTLAEARHPAFNNNGSRLKVLQGGASVGSHSIISGSSNSAEKKVGSFQEFLYSECTMDDISPSMISVEEVHKIAILDIRIMNADRNSANLLCRRNEDGSLELVPIDHGFCLRSVADVAWMDWCWLDWPQLKEPLSERSKSYIQNLDIEGDARLLRERLNICPEAIDYFRASSRLLKAGVNAGLTLSEIALMCCRNDNMGEIPSKLEMLVSMASDVAQSAIENGRWHHSAASSALAEQLSPQDGTLPSHGMNRMHKSCAQFQAVFTLEDDEKRDNAPGMVQSSASDSSSEVEDIVDDAEDCEEWAAAVIADVSLDIPVGNRSRSLSESDESCSDSDNLSSSPKGFWHIRPDSLPCNTLDDGSVSWSEEFEPEKNGETLFPSLSSISRMSVSLRGSFSEREPAPLRGDSKGKTIMKKVDVTDSTKYEIKEISFPTISVDAFDEPLEKTETSVCTFAEPEVQDVSYPGLVPYTGTAVQDLCCPSPEPKECMSRRPTVSFALHDKAHEDTDNVSRQEGLSSISIPLKKPEGGLTRSLSYSALSAVKSVVSIESSAQGPPEPFEKAYDQFRDYFLKFVDLLIVRETSAASRKMRTLALSRQGMN